MALTKAKISNIDTSIEFFQDPIILLNEKSTLANIDVGFVFNRNGGTDPNVSIYWNETTKSFTLAYTANNGILNSNISVNSYANITVGNIYSSGNVTATYFIGNGALLTGIVAGSDYSNVQVATYLPTYTGVVAASNVFVSGNVTAQNLIGNISGTSANVTLQAGAYTSVFDNQGNVTVPRLFTAGNIQTAGYLFGNGEFLTGLPAGYSNVNVKAYTETMGFTNFSNVNVAALITTNGLTNYSNVNVKAYTETMGFQNYGNVNVAAYTQTQSYTNYSNVNVAALITTNGLTNYSNVNAKAYTESMGFQNYSNVNVAALITTNGLTNFSNVNVAAYTQTQSYTNYSNVNLTAYLGGAVTVGGNLTVQGNLFVNGNVTVFNTNNLSINDSMIYLADDNPADLVDIGFVSAFTNPGYQHTGFVRDATDGVWKLFANVIPEPTTTVDFTNANYSNILVGNIQATYFTGNGAFLTGLPAGYSNVNAATFLASGTLTSPIITTGTAATGNLTVNSGEATAYAVVSNTNAYQTSMSVNTAAGSLAVSWGTNASPTAFMSMTASGGTNQINSVARNFKVNFTALNDALLLYAANGAAVFKSTIASTSTTTGALTVTGGVGIGGNVYTGGRAGFTYANNVSAVYQVYNNATNSLDTVFG